MKITVAQAIVRCLELEGVEYAFGLTGSHFLAFFDALKDSKIKFISVKHEGAAGFMALNYTKVAQKPALLLGTAGPGAMNLVNGLAELYKAGIPAFVLSPLVPRSKFGKNSTQEDSGWGNCYSVVDVMQAVTRKSLLAVAPEKVPDAMRDLFRIGFYQQYGPVHMGVPTDLFDSEIDFEPLEPQAYRAMSDERIEENKLAKCAQLITEAKRPLLLIGERTVFPDCSSALKCLVDEFRLPFILTHNAKSVIDEDNILFGGILNFWGHKSAEKLVKEADFLLSLGADFNEETTMRYDPDLLKSCTHVSIDSNHLEIGRNYPVTFGIHGNIKLSVLRLASLLKNIGYRHAMDCTGFQKTIQACNAYVVEEQSQRTMPLKPQTIFSELGRVMPENATVFLDVGAASWWSVRNMPVKGYRYFISGTGFSMAQAVAGCIGGKLAAPDRHSVCICGDGAFLMHGNELLTAVQYGVGITWVIFKDDYYNMIEMNQRLAYDGKLEYCSKIKNPDYSLLAQAFGCRYFEINQFSDIRNCMNDAFSANAKNECALVVVNYDFKELLPLKPRLIAIMKDMGQTKDMKSNPYLMKAFVKALKEKV
jgi:acetolactate synthase I/II/III large subunit